MSDSSDLHGNMLPVVREDDAPGSREFVNEWTVLCNSLDAIVRSVRTNPAILQKLVGRTLEHWLGMAKKELQLVPTGLSHDGEVVYTTTEDEGQWILPAFMAGLRTIRPVDEVVRENLVNLAHELAELAPTDQLINRFRDWLWADGAEGFDISLDVSFAEGIETAFDDLGTRRQNLASMRVDAIRSLCEDAIEISSRSLDLAAARQEFQVPLENFGQRLKDNTLRATQAEIAELRHVTEDGYFWMNAQVALALASPEIQGVLQPERLVRHLIQSMQDRIDLRFVDLLARVGKQDEPYARKLVEALEGQPIGAIIGASIKFDREGLRSLAGIIVSGPRSIVQGIASGLLERSVEDRYAFASLKKMAPSVVFNRFFEVIAIEELSPKAAQTLGVLLLRSKDPRAHLPGFMDRVPVAVTIPVLSQATPELVWSQRERVNLILERPIAEAERRNLVRLLLATGDPRWKPILGDALLVTGGHGWCPATLGVVCRELVSARLAEVTLVPLVRNPKAAEGAVLAALCALENAPELLREASQFSLRELVTSNKVRVHLQRARKKLKDIDGG